MDFKNMFNLDKLNKGIKNIQNKKHIKNLVILALVGVLLIIFSNTLKDMNTSKVNVNFNKNNLKDVDSKSKDENRKNIKISQEEEKIEKKLKETLEDIEGVGRVKVMVYFKGGEEEIPAININDSTSVTEEKDTDGGTRQIKQKNDGRSIVMMNTENGTKPFVVKKYKPQVTGVCVVSEGAENNLIKLQIHKAVIDLFDLKENQVNVYPMKR